MTKFHIELNNFICKYFRSDCICYLLNTHSQRKRQATIFPSRWVSCDQNGLIFINCPTPCIKVRLKSSWDWWSIMALLFHWQYLYMKINNLLTDILFLDCNVVLCCGICHCCQLQGVQSMAYNSHIYHMQHNFFTGSSNPI